MSTKFYVDYEKIPFYDLEVSMPDGTVQVFEVALKNEIDKLVFENDNELNKKIILSV